MKLMKTQWIALSSAALLAVILVAAGGCQVIRAGYETAPYRVLESDGAFQIREYPAMQWVETTMGSGNGDSDGSFGRLFGFITGRNQSQQKIAMTTPVYMAGSPTADPASQRVMAFVMPKAMAATSVPVPTMGPCAEGRFRPAGLLFIGSAEPGPPSGRWQFWVNCRPGWRLGGFRSSMLCRCMATSTRRGPPRFSGGMRLC